MNTLQRLTFSTLTVAAALVVATTQAGAYSYQSQSQSFSSEFSSSVNCEGNCNGKAEVTSKTSMDQSQVQRMGTGTGSGGSWGSNWGDRDDWDNKGRSNRNDWGNKQANTDGQVRLNWNMRDGTCRVRYKEANARSYNYTAHADCNDGGITIGGLVEGRNYHFQVKKDGDEKWSRPILRRAQ